MHEPENRQSNDAGYAAEAKTVGERRFGDLLSLGARWAHQPLLGLDFQALSRHSARSSTADGRMARKNQCRESAKTIAEAK